jgi:hypothetical protein
MKGVIACCTSRYRIPTIGPVSISASIRCNVEPGATFLIDVRHAPSLTPTIKRLARLSRLFLLVAD